MAKKRKSEGGVKLPEHATAKDKASREVADEIMNMGYEHLNSLPMEVQIEIAEFVIYETMKANGIPSGTSIVATLHIAAKVLGRIAPNKERLSHDLKMATLALTMTAEEEFKSPESTAARTGIGSTARH